MASHFFELVALILRDGMFMFKNKQKNQYGTFIIGKSGDNKTSRILITALLAVIFVLGTGLIMFNKNKKPKEQAIVETAELDGIPGWWYQQYFGSSICDEDTCRSDADPDNDKLSNSQEFYYHTNPLNGYTVGDALMDGELVAGGFDPSKPGKVTFDQAASPEKLLGESLIFGQDIKQMVSDDLDISKVNLPIVKDDELQIIYAEDEETYKNYSSKLEMTINKYFREQDVGNIKEILKSGSDGELSDIGVRAVALSNELKKIPVPLKLLMFHKYNVAMFQLLSEVIPVPANLSDSQSDAWFEKVQAFLVVQQKLSFEEQALNR